MAFDPDFESVVLLLHCDGADASTSFPDDSDSDHSVTVRGNAQVDTAQSKFGGAALLLDGSSDYLEYADSDDWSIGSGNYTFECWIRPSANGVSYEVFGQTDSSASASSRAFLLRRQSDNTIRFIVYDAGTAYPVTTSGTTTANTWHHVSGCFDGSNVYVSLDGTVTSASATSVTVTDSTQIFSIGAWGAWTSSNYFNGHIDDVRLTKGVARYTSNFSVPTEAHPNTSLRVIVGDVTRTRSSAATMALQPFIAGINTRTRSSAATMELVLPPGIVGDVTRTRSSAATMALQPFIAGINTRTRSSAATMELVLPPGIVGDVTRTRSSAATMALPPFIAGINTRARISNSTIAKRYAVTGNVTRTRSSVATTAAVFRGTLSFTFNNILSNASGFLSVRFKNTVYNRGVLGFTFNNLLSDGSGVLGARFNNKLFSRGVLSFTFNNTLYAAATGSSRYFGEAVRINGVDVSTRITGEVTVVQEEGKASLADFNLLPFSGSINPYDWIGQSVEYDYIEKNSSGATIVSHRLFTGVVHLPTYDIATKITLFKCTDGLQESFELNNRDYVDAQVSGYWSDAVHNAPNNNWDYAQQRLKSIASSYDLDVYRAPRLTPWQPKATADFSYTRAVHNSISLKLTERRNLINQVQIEFGFRYGRKWQREISARWLHGQTFTDWLFSPQSLPSEERITGAAGDWLVKNINSTGLSPSGIYYKSGSPFIWAKPDDSVAVLEANLTLSKRWLQSIREKYLLTVKSDTSITQHGLLSVENKFSLDAVSNDDVSNGEVYEAPTGTKINSTDFIDSVYKDGNSRASSDDALQTAIAIAQTRILETHRTNSIDFEVLLEPTIDVSKTAQLTTTELTGKGKVNKVVHKINAAQGLARSIITLAIYQPNASGQSNDVVTVPVLPSTNPSTTTQTIELDEYIGGRTQVPQDEDWRGWIGNYFFVVPGVVTYTPEIYEEEFVLETPEIPSSQRDAVEFEASQIYQVAIPEDNLVIAA